MLLSEAASERPPFPRHHAGASGVGFGGSKGGGAGYQWLLNSSQCRVLHLSMLAKIRTAARGLTPVISLGAG